MSRKEIVNSNYTYACEEIEKMLGFKIDIEKDVDKVVSIETHTNECWGTFKSVLEYLEAFSPDFVNAEYDQGTKTLTIYE